jgi:hypothetical protein
VKIAGITLFGAASPSHRSNRRTGTCRYFAILVTILTFLYVSQQPVGDLTSSGGSRGVASVNDANLSRCGKGLPHGVTSVYPCAGGAGIFGSTTSRVFVTFIGEFMNEWYLASLRALVLVHCGEPNVAVIVWANELTDIWFDKVLGDLVDADGKPRVRLVRYNATELAFGVIGAEKSMAYLQDPIRKLGAPPGAFHPLEPQMLMAHITDVLRMVILYRFGGVYLDVDILPLRPIHALGTRFAANLGNYDCTQALREDWPKGSPVDMPLSLGGDRVTCMCVCFLSFPNPRNALIGEVLVRGLDAFLQRGGVYGGFGAWVFMDALRVMAPSPNFDASPLSVTDILCWPSVLDATLPQSEENLKTILRDCSAVHMMGGGHARKFSANISGDDTLFGQVYSRARAQSIIPDTCSGVKKGGQRR